MYLKYFGLDKAPFTIAPDPKFLYLSPRHREALGHLIYGVKEQGGFVLLTGEVGTGKTTVCRCFLEQLPDNTDVAFIVNPRMSATEMLATLCDELQVSYPKHNRSVKVFIDLLTAFLLDNHRKERNTTMIIDEAQNLSFDVLEQLRLLTNLETSEKKLLQIVLLGQPELQDMLCRQQLRQLNQRITARYHLTPLSRDEVRSYVKFRIQVAGNTRDLFSKSAIDTLYRLSGGIPRQLNLLADRALLGAYAENETGVLPKHVKSAAKELNIQSAWRTSINNTFRSAALSTYLVAFCAFLLPFIVGFYLKNNDIPSAEQSNEISAFETLRPMPNLGTPDDAVDTTRSGLQRQPLDLEKNAYQQHADALVSLFGVWTSIDSTLDNLSNPQNCRDVVLSGLQCSQKNGTWRTIAALNRPAILYLRDTDGKNYFAVLTRLENNEATVLSPKGAMSVTLKSLDQFWWGEYEILWRTPSFRSNIVQPGKPKTRDQWVNEAFVKYLELNGHEMDSTTVSILEASDLSTKVTWFQQKSGLVSDGIAGEHTMISLNEVLYPASTPMLNASKYSGRGG